MPNRDLIRSGALATPGPKKTKTNQKNPEKTPRESP